MPSVFLSAESVDLVGFRGLGRVSQNWDLHIDTECGIIMCNTKQKKRCDFYV